MATPDAIDENALVERVWKRDASLWGPPGASEIADRLGWLDVPERMRESIVELRTWAAEMHAAGFVQTVLLGMGGSSLGPEVLRRAFGKSLRMLDGTDPGAVREVTEAIDPARTLFVVSSKSGGTIETLSHFAYFYALTGGNGEQFAVVTDPGSPLAERAAELGLAKVWLADPQIGGRYSVLSLFGLVPAALEGLPLDELIESATAELQSCRAAANENSGLSLGLELGQLALDGRDKLTFAVSGPLKPFGLWAEQLIAESTGKHGRGILPVDGEPLGRPNDYGDDRVFLHIRADGTYDDAITAMAEAGHPVIEIDGYDGAHELGALFYMFEFATAVAGHVIGVNPFDQPNVQSAKDATAEVLASGDTVAPFDGPDALAQLVSGLEPPGYFAALGYLAPDDEFEAAIGELRLAVRRATCAATTFGYGPRYLHSTGQLHKGGAPGGRFVQFVHESGDDIAVPGHDYTFRELKNAQATGDYNALRDAGRQVVRLKLEGDPAAAVRELARKF
ncbi:MAG: glucose-6-phosphate isomerase [Actinobacteria bacterium]|nr:glucose-6-phosphate isomerase [Actinomycetota bacterium]